MKKITTTHALIGTVCLNLIVIGIFFGPIWSCTDFTDEYHFYVAPELKPFVDGFYREAKKRGFDLPTDGLSVALVHYENGDAGDCLVGSFIIFLDPYFVHNLLRTGLRGDSLYVEWVVFHELGHGLLYENHRGSESILNAHNEHIYQYATDEVARQRMISELFAHYIPL